MKTKKSHLTSFRVYRFVERKGEIFYRFSRRWNASILDDCSIRANSSRRKICYSIKFLIKFRRSSTESSFIPTPTIGPIGTPADPRPKTRAKKYLRAWPRKWAINGNSPAIIGIQGVRQLFPKSRQYPFNFQDYSRRFELITRDRE